METLYRPTRPHTETVRESVRLRQSSLFRWCLLSAHAVVPEPCLSNVLGKQLLLLLWLLLEVLLLLRVLAVLLLHL